MGDATVVDGGGGGDEEMTMAWGDDIADVEFATGLTS